MGKLKGKARAKANKKKRLQNKNDYFIRRKNLLSRIRKWEDPILKKPCEPTGVFDDITGIVKELKQVLAATDTGLGIAASQIGYIKKIFVIRPDIKSGTMTVFVNSDIVGESKERSVRAEGCLSYPNFFTNIDRPAEITLKYEDEFRNPKKSTFRGLEACVICHEHDHTLGVCLVADAYRKKDDEPEEESVPEEVKKDEAVTAVESQQS